MEVEDESKKQNNDLKQKEEENKDEIIDENKDKNKSIEIYLKNKIGKISPTIYIEYPKINDSSPLSKLDSENLKTFLSKFGKISFIEIYKLIALVQFETFLSAYTCLKYFEKINENKEEKILCRWFEERDEEIVTNDIISKIRKLKPYEIVENINNQFNNK